MVVVEVRIGLGGGEGDIIGGVGRRGGAKLGIGNGTGRDYRPGMKVGRTK